MAGRSRSSLPRPDAGVRSGRALPRRRNPSVRRGARAVLLALGLALAVDACAAPHSAPAGEGAAARAAVDRSSPQSVALEYTRELFTGQFTRAEQLVLPKDRGTLHVLTFSLAPDSVHARDLAVGSARLNGDTAVAVLTGTLCSNGRNRTPDGATATPPADACISNTAPDSANPAFRVALVRTGGEWYVNFPGMDPAKAPTPRRSAPGSGPASASASAGETPARMP